MKATVMICYRTFDGEELLSYIHYTKEQAQKDVDKLNAEKPETLWNGEKIDWTKIKEFFVSAEEFWGSKWGCE